MKASILLLFLLLLPADFSALADDSPAEGPHLQISSVYGNLEVGRPSSIFVVLQNNASPPKVPDEPGFSQTAAAHPAAELRGMQSAAARLIEIE